MANFGGIQNIILPQMNLPLFMNQNLGGMNNLMGMQMNNHQFNQGQKQFNQNLEEKNYGKSTIGNNKKVNMLNLVLTKLSILANYFLK